MKLLFIMSASLRAPCFRARGRSPFLFCNLFSNTSFSKQQLTLISVWSWLAPGPLISKRASCAVSQTDVCSLVCLIVDFFWEVGLQVVWGRGKSHDTLESDNSWASTAGIIFLKWKSLVGILKEPEERVKWTGKRLCFGLENEEKMCVENEGEGKPVKSSVIHLYHITGSTSETLGSLIF